MTGYRYPNEQITLAGTVILILVVFAFTAGVSLCIGPIFFGLFLLMAYQSTITSHRELLQKGLRVSAKETPDLFRLVQDCVNKLRPGSIEAIVVRSNQLNAYTFGLNDPKVVVLFEPLFQVMDESELHFVVGHELGHVALGHTWLNTLLGGMAGLPPSIGAAAIMALAFRGWNRACEFSADRAGLIACGSLSKATSALVKLVAHNVRTPAQIEQALKVIDKEDESLGNVLAETLSTHPMIIHRVEHLRQFAASAEYKKIMGNQ